MKLGIVLRKWRKMSDLDLRSAAKMMGLSAPTLMRLEGGRDPRGETLARILKWLLSAKE